MTSSPRSAVVVALLTLAACAETPPARWHDEAGYRWRELRVRGGQPGYTRVTSSGVDFQNAVSDSTLLRNRYLGHGSGVAIGDVDGDSLPDVFLGKTEGCNALYRNLGEWKFENIAKAAGVEACDRYSTGTAMSDVDGDGDLDLIVLAATGPNAVFVNDGKARFTERRDLGLDSLGKGGTTLAMSDVDGDGDLDMYVANYRPWSVEDSLPPQQRSFNQVVQQVGPNRYDIVPERKNEFKVVMRPDMGGLKMTTRGATDDFYRFENGKFVRVPFAGGAFTNVDGKPLTEEAESFGLGAKFVDFTGDGAPDLYVVNDFEDTDELWVNNGRGQFRLSDWKAQRQMSNSAMGIDVADLNGDGLPDLFEVDMLANDRRIKTQIPTHTAIPKKAGTMDLVLQQQRNTMFANRGDGTFAEVAMAAGVEASGWSWSTILTDVDLDGWNDILVTNGHFWDLMDADVQERIQNRLTDVDWRHLRWQFKPLKLKNVAYRNRGDMTFVDAGTTWKFGLDEDISHGMALGDLDGDGDLDVVVNRLGSTALLLRNDAAAKRVSVRLRGDAPNTMGVGAKIRLLGGAVPSQEREVSVGGIYLSHSDFEASFAMGTSDSATLIVDWRDGRRTTINGIRPDREYVVSQASAARPASIEPPEAPVKPLFSDVTAMLGGHVHSEDDFDDWGRQFLLPNALSMMGPGVSWFDVDRDGDEDLLVGAGGGGKISTFRNDRGALRLSSASPSVPYDVTSVLGFSDGRQTRVLAGLSTWQARTIPELTGTPAVLGLAVDRGQLAPRFDSIVGSHESSTGPLALSDYDGDGDLDLFIGSRAIPLRYPVAASSGFFRNDNGKFVLDKANTAAVAKIGLVSSAVFADINGDGFDDLLLAREWGSIALLINNAQGAFRLAPASLGLARWTGRWNGIATGDLDGDGRLDIVATNWGRNTIMKADTTHPLVMVHGPFGAAGEEEMLIGRYDSRVKGVAPYNSYARVRVAVPSIVQRLSSFSAYADANIDGILSGMRVPLERLEAVTLDHTLFLNRGDHFEPRSMPAEAQLAPAFYAGVADFDGDGKEDVFIGQNFSPTIVGQPRYDAGRSLLMTGDGKGGLTPVSGMKSGLAVYGDQRGAGIADYDADGRVDLVVSQNGAATKLYHNDGARPGLRVRLAGTSSNPDGVGAIIRVNFGQLASPARQVQAGSGFWSQNGAVQVFSGDAPPTEVWVRWPGGKETRTPVPASAREITVRTP